MRKPLPSDVPVQWYRGTLHDVDPITCCAIVFGEQPGSIIRIPFDRCNSEIVCLESGAEVTLVRSSVDRFKGYWLTAIHYASIRTHTKPYPDSQLQLIDIGSRRDCYVTISGTDFATYVPKTGTLDEQLLPISQTRYRPVKPGDDWSPPIRLPQAMTGTVFLATVTWRDPLGRWFEVRVNDYEDYRIPIDHENPKFEHVHRGDTVLIVGDQAGIRLLCHFVHMGFRPIFNRMYRNDEGQVVLEIACPTQVIGESFYIDIENKVHMWQRPLTDVGRFNAFDEPVQGVVPANVSVP